MISTCHEGRKREGSDYERGVDAERWSGKYVLLLGAVAEYMRAKVDREEGGNGAQLGGWPAWQSLPEGARAGEVRK